MYSKIGKNNKITVWLLIGILCLVTSCQLQVPAEESSYQQSYPPIEVPQYEGNIYTIMNENIPNFTEDEITTETFEYYSELDYLGRCGVAFACLGIELLPTEERESISEVIPSGWINVEYDHVDGGYLYNRSHLIGFQLAGENANEKNLITGTRSFNGVGMLFYENLVVNYIKEMNHHVMYRVTPVYEGSDLVAKGVLMEAYSVEDKGEGITFSVFVHNVEEQIEIDYATGVSNFIGIEDTEEEKWVEHERWNYILNTNTMKFHIQTCSSVEDISEHNKEGFLGTSEEAVNLGYEPCKRCNP